VVPEAGEGHLVAGRYRLVSRIGTGAMGVVWQGHDERLDRPVAVKRLLPRPGGTGLSAQIARCLREGRIAARLHHPNAVTIFDVVDDDGVPNLVMEYVRSSSLATVITEHGPLPPDEVAAIGTQVAAALAAAHAAGIVHRDVTPGNILLGEDGTAKLTDFGISLATGDATVTKSGVVAGTPAYLAPEVALGAEPTPASDVFSLGATLYAAVEGEPPFGHGQNVLGLLHSVAIGEINPPRRSGQLTGTLLTLLTADPTARPSAADVRDRLAAPADDERPVEDSTVLLAAPTAADRGSRRPYAVAGVLVVALIAVGLWLLGGRDSVVPRQDRDPADGGSHHQPTGTSVSVPVVPAADVPTVHTERQAGTTTSGKTPGTTNAPANPPSNPSNPGDEPTTTTSTTSEVPDSTSEVPTTTSTEDGGDNGTVPPSEPAAG